MKFIKVFLIVCLVFFMVVVITWQISKSRSFQFWGEIITRIETNKKVVALTFDDGPTKNTQAVLDILNELGVRATFFVSGAELKENPDQGRMIVFKGHELGNHSYSHQRMVLKSARFYKEEIENTDELIRQAGYKGEIYFRPPFGKKLIGLPYYLNKQNRKTIMWDIEPESYPDVAGDSNKIVDYVLKNSNPGSIILLHVMYDSRKESVSSIKGVVTSLQKKGYKFVTVSELLKENVRLADDTLRK